MKKYAMLALLLLLTGCGKGNDEAHDPAIDSIVRPQAPVAVGDAIEIDSSSGVLIDRSRMRTPEHYSTMERFEPTAVVSIYTQFRPLRKPGLSKSSLDSFLNYHKLSHKELQAILAEGDQLGWNRVDTSLPKPH